MEHSCIIPLAIFCLSALANGGVEEGREYVPFIENEIELIHERHMYTDFRYITASTAVPTDYTEIPEDKKATLREAHGIKECATQFKIRFPFYKNSKRPVCLFKDTTWVVPKNSTIEISGEAYSKKDFIDEVHPVRGFVVNEMNSLVRGYIIEGSFYGIIRIFDEFYAYHLHFYIEPIDNLDIYTDIPIDEKKKNEEHNAIIFEYGANGEHEQERPPEDVAKQLYEKIRNATGGPVLTEVGRLASLNDTFSDPHKNNTHLIHTHNTNTTGGEHETVSQQRKEATANEMEDTPEQIALRFHDDVAGAVHLQGGVSSSDILDTATTSSYLCTLCVWVQPLFAKKFGFKRGQIFGASEIISMLKRMDWLFRAMDFNVDSVAENFGFRIKSIYVSDKIHVGKKKVTTSAPENENNQTRKRRSVKEEDTPKRVVREAEEEAKPRSKKKLPKGKRTYNEILRQIKGLHEFSECCATIAFVYLDMTPVLSVSTLRGLCSKENLVLVSGMFFGHKVGIYDIQRALFHAFGHMLGATHDKSLRARCQDRKPAKFYNPFLMHPVQQANVGLRPNSYKLSFCSKLEVTGFLNSNNLQKCLVTGENDRFCGNGMLDPGEECDCGSAWQCHLQECCGESDTIFNCKPVKLGRQVICERPMQW